MIKNQFVREEIGWISLSPRRLLFITALIVISVLTYSCRKQNECNVSGKEIFNEGIRKVETTLSHCDDRSMMPRYIPKGETGWSTTPIYSWTSGFWPGILWLVYEYTGDPKWKTVASEWTVQLEPVKSMNNPYHDIGFIMFNSFGNGYKLTGNQEYIPILIETADSLISLFNPNVGTILSWPFMYNRIGYNTIIDNLMNLELLFWASKISGNTKYYEYAYSHAYRTKQHHIRQDSSTYHVVIFDKDSGEVINKLTHQGHSDESMWARGQAWGIYGFAIAYRETGDIDFLDAACALADKYLSELPNDLVPFWDFRSPEIPDTYKDASAAAIASSALFELSDLVADKVYAERYIYFANLMIESLYCLYIADNTKDSILDHSVGNYKSNSEIDVPLIYADYYFLEALIKQRKMGYGNTLMCH